MPTTMMILSMIPINVWYLLIASVCLILIVIECVPKAGERIALFIQKMIDLRNDLPCDQGRYYNSRQRKQSK